MTDWTELTDEDRDAAFKSLPGEMGGYMKLWGWLHYAKAIEAQVQAKNARLVAIARAGLKYCGGVDETRALMTRGLRDAADYKRFEELRISNNTDEEEFRAALRLALGEKADG